MVSITTNSARPNRTVLVIGAGVAGSCCAIRLRQHGFDVQLAEKATFPRGKVCGCCIGAAGLSVLDQLSLRDLVMQSGVPTFRWVGSMAGRRLQVPLPEGVAISRERLDTMLLDVATQAGAEVFSPMEARVECMDDDAVSVVLQGPGVPARVQRYGAVVIASGLNASGSQRLLPWREEPNGPFGVSFFARSDSLPRGVIHMACDDDGYVGLVRLEDDRVDIAAALNSGAAAADQGSSHERIDRILTRSRLTDWQYFDATPLMTTPPLRRRRHAGNGRVIAIGDAAGYVEPFTGEGMTWGMASALAAADWIVEFPDPWSGLGQPWSQKLDALLRTKRLACRAVTTTLRSPIARRAIAATLAQWPAMAAPLLKHLSHL